MRTDFLLFGTFGKWIRLPFDAEILVSESIWLFRRVSSLN